MSQVAALARLTVTSPAEAARAILSREWPMQALWTGLVLSIVLNAMVYTLQRWMFPLPEGAVFPEVSGIGYFVLMLALQIGFVAMLTMSGRWLGGQGRLPELLAVLVWLQLLQVCAQAAVTALYLVIPALSALLNLAINLFAVYILLHFINEAHRLASIWRALGVLLMSSIAILFAFLFLAGLMGPAFLGLPDNV